MRQTRFWVHRGIFSELCNDLPIWKLASRAVGHVHISVAAHVFWRNTVLRHQAFAQRNQSLLLFIGRLVGQPPLLVLEIANQAYSQPVVKMWAVCAMALIWPATLNGAIRQDHIVVANVIHLALIGNRKSTAACDAIQSSSIKQLTLPAFCRRIRVMNENAGRVICERTFRCRSDWRSDA